MKKIVSLFMVAILPLLFIHARAYSDQVDPVLVPAEEIEKVLDFRQLEPFQSLDCTMFASILPIHQEGFTIYFRDFCDGSHPVVMTLDPQHQVSHWNYLFKDYSSPYLTAIPSLRISYDPYAITQDNNQYTYYIGRLSQKGEGIFKLNQAGYVTHVYPFEQTWNESSLYNDADETLYFTTSHHLYALPLPLEDASEHQEIFSLKMLDFNDAPSLADDDSMSIKHILNVSENQFVLVLENETLTSIVAIDRSTHRVVLLLTQPPPSTKPEHTSSRLIQYLNDRVMLSDFIRQKKACSLSASKNETKTQRYAKLYDTKGRLLAQWMNHPHENKNYSRYMTVRQTESGTYLYWIDDFILYRWKVPII